MPLRLVHLVSHPIQYFAPLYRELAARPELDFSVYFGRPDQTGGGYEDEGFNRRIRWDVDLLSGYTHYFPPTPTRSRTRPKSNLSPTLSVIKQIIQRDFDVLWVHGYVSTNSWLAAAIAFSKGKPVLLRDDQHNTDTRNTFRSRLKRQFLPLLLSNVNPIYVGENNRKFFEYYGVPPKRLFPARHCVDNAFFEQRHAALKPRRSELRRGLGINEDSPVILFSGKMIDKKKPGLLLEAFEQVRRRTQCHLLMVGDGKLLEELKSTAGAKQIPDVHWAGFLNQTELPNAYAAADVLVLPSAYEETWGLVVNEAMNFRLPIVVSDKVGCAADLVHPGDNGFVFKSGDSNELAMALDRLVNNRELREKYGEESARIVSTYTIENCATQISAAAHAVSKHDRKAGAPIRSVIQPQ